MLGRNEVNPNLQIPLSKLGKRTSEDDMNSEFETRLKEKRDQRDVEAQSKEKRYQRDRKEAWVKKEIKQRKRFLEGTHYCCDCKGMRKVRESGVETICNSCRHQRCLFCMVPQC